MNYKEIPDGSFGGTTKKGVQVYCDNRGLTYTVVSMALCQVKVGRTAVSNNDWNVVENIPYFVHNYVNNFNVGAKVIHIFTGEEFILKTRGLVRGVCQVETGEGDTVNINPERLMPIGPGMVLRHRKTGTEKVFLNLADYEREKAAHTPLGCYVAGDVVRQGKNYHVITGYSSSKRTELAGTGLAADNTGLTFAKKAQILRLNETGQFIYQAELQSGRVSYYNQSGTKLNLTRKDLTSWIEPGWDVIYQDKIGVSVDGGVQLGDQVLTNVDIDDIQVLCPGDIVTFQGKTSTVSHKKGDKWVADNGQVYENQPDGWGVTDDGLWLSPSKVLYKIVDAKLKTVSFRKYKGEPVQAVHEEVVPLEVKNAVLGIRVGNSVINVFSGQRAEIIDISIGESAATTILGISIEGGDRQPVYCSAWAAKTGLMPVRSARTREGTDLKSLKLGEGFTQMGELMRGDVVKLVGSQDIAGVVLREADGQVSLGFGNLASACEYEIVGKATRLNSPALGEFWVYENFRWCGGTGKDCYTGYWLWSGGNEYLGPDNKLYVLANEKFEMVSVYSEVKDRAWAIIDKNNVPTSILNMQANLAIGEPAAHIYTGDIELITSIDLPFITLGDKKAHSSFVVPLSQIAPVRDLKTGKIVSYKDISDRAGFRMLGEFHVGDVVKIDGEIVCLITKCKAAGRFLTSKGVTDFVDNMEWVGSATLKDGFWVYDNIKWNAGTGETVTEWKVSEGGVYFAPNGLVYQITHPHWNGVSIFTLESFSGCEPKAVKIKVEEIPFAVLNAYYGVKVGLRVKHLFTGKEFVVSEIRTGIVEVENGVSFNSWVMVGLTNYRLVRDVTTGKIRRMSSDPSSEKLLGQLSPGDYVQHIAGDALGVVHSTQGEGRGININGEMFPVLELVFISKTKLAYHYKTGEAFWLVDSGELGLYADSWSVETGLKKPVLHSALTGRISPNWKVYSKGEFGLVYDGDTYQISNADFRNFNLRGPRDYQFVYPGAKITWVDGKEYTLKNQVSSYSWETECGKVLSSENKWLQVTSTVYVGPDEKVYQICDQVTRAVTIRENERLAGAMVKESDVPLEILNKFHGWKVGANIRNIYTNKHRTISKIIDDRHFVDETGNELLGEMFAVENDYMPVRTLTTRVISYLGAMKGAYRNYTMAGTIVRGDVIRKLDSEELFVAMGLVGDSEVLVGTTLKLPMDKVRFVGRADYTYQGKNLALCFGSTAMSDFEKVSKAILEGARHINEESARVKSTKTVVDQEFNQDSGVHRLVLSTIADGQIQAEVFGPWVPSRAVAAVGDYRAFHPRHMAEGLPRLFRIIDCG